MESVLEWWRSRPLKRKAGISLWVFLGCLLAPFILGALARIFLPPNGSVVATIEASRTLFAVLSVLGLFAGIGFYVAHLIQAGRRGVMLIRAKREFKRDFLDAVADNVLTEEEARHLMTRAEELGLPGDHLVALRQGHFETAMAPIMRTVRKERRMSPEQEEALMTASRDLKITLELDEELEKYKALWRIETTGEYRPSPLPDPPIRLTKNEECYFSAPATWNQMKIRRIHQGYVGGSVGFRVAKGVTLRVGRAVPVVDEVEELAEIDSGMIYITNKKVVFVGARRSTNVTFGRLANYELFRDAVQLNKTSGKADVLILHEDDIQLVDALLQVL